MQSHLAYQIALQIKKYRRNSMDRRNQNGQTVLVVTPKGGDPLWKVISSDVRELIVEN